LSLAAGSAHELLFGRPPRSDEAPGTWTRFALDWSHLKAACWIVGGIWLLGTAAVVTSWHPYRVRGLFGGVHEVSPPVALVVITVAALWLFAIGIRNYRHAINVVFTSEGVWTPRWRGGRFLPWVQVVATRLVDHGRGATEIELSYPEGRYRIWAVGFRDPYAVSRFIKKHMGEAATELPSDGEI
jgi:hypothetical protein